MFFKALVCFCCICNYSIAQPGQALIAKNTSPLQTSICCSYHFPTSNYSTSCFLPRQEENSVFAAKCFSNPLLLLRTFASVNTIIFKDSSDRDGDGIVDSLDKCPDEKGVLQYDGCPIPDSDNDGIADDVDKCPTIAGSLKNNGCPPGDKDGDKINDDEDKCPAEPGVARNGGCPIKDTDGDGVDDENDNCINVPGTLLNAGCPEDKKGKSAGKRKGKD